VPNNYGIIGLLRLERRKRIKVLWPRHRQKCGKRGAAARKYIGSLRDMVFIQSENDTVEAILIWLRMAACFKIWTQMEAGLNRQKTVGSHLP
jgi:hypothetical protein